MAQTLVAEAANQQREGDAMANRQGLVLLLISGPLQLCLAAHAPGRRLML